MTLLAPLFLLGLVTIGLPIWLHRLQTETKEREAFSSSMLLEKSEQRVHLQKQLKHLILLALRILLLIFLALAFTKPFWEFDDDSLISTEGNVHLLVIDNSFSMSANGTIQRAKALANEIISDMEDDDVAQIISASGRTVFHSRLEVDKNILSGAINLIDAGIERLDYGKMMIDLNSYRDDLNSNVHVHLISDFQTSGMPGRFADMILNSTPGYGVELSFYPARDDALANLTIEHASFNNDELTISIRNHAETNVTNSLSLIANDTPIDEKEFEVAANSLLQLEFNELPLDKGDNEIVLKLVRDDSLPGDDQRFFTITNSEPSPVLLISSRPDSRASIYLAAALETENYSVEIVPFQNLDPRLLTRYPWLIIEDLGSISQNLVSSLDAYLANGNSILAALGDNSLVLDQLPVSSHQIENSSISTPQSQFVNITRIDSSHPVLVNTSGWRGVNISKTVELVPAIDDRILINLENNKPLLLERTFGAGKLLLLASSLDNTWSDLPVHPVFVSFIAEVAKYLGDENNLGNLYDIGDTLVMQQSGAGAGQVIAPSGETILSLEDTMTGKDIILDQRGFYQLITASDEMKIAVNLDPRESETELMDSETMDRWKNTSSSRQTVAAETYINDAEPVIWELWHSLLIILGLIVLAESLLGNRYLNFRSGV